MGSCQQLIWEKDLVYLKRGLGLMVNVSILQHLMVIFLNDKVWKVKAVKPKSLPSKLRLLF